MAEKLTDADKILDAVTGFRSALAAKDAEIERLTQREAELVDERARFLRRWQKEEPDDDWGNEYAAVVTFKAERDDARARVAELEALVEEMAESQRASNLKRDFARELLEPTAETQEEPK